MDVSELSRLFLEQRHMLLSYIHALVRDVNDAEDLFQEVGVQILAKTDAPVQRDAFAAWCRGIAKNKILHYWRSQRRSRVMIDSRLLDALELAYVESDAQPGDAVAQSRALGECLRELASHAREVLEMRYFHGRKSAEIADVLDRTPAAVRQMLVRIRGRLLKCIHQRLATGANLDD